jgi:hypothetical protein
MIKNENIKKYYQEAVLESGGDFDNFLKQVGKTFLGNTINKDIFYEIVESISNALNIDRNDQVIDLGCANGLITKSIANNSEHVFAFDLSDDLIQVAKKFHKKENITYKVKNVLDVNFGKLNVKKIYMYEVLQHFEYRMLRELLMKLTTEMDSFVLFIGSVPDKDKILNFYDTDKRKSFLFNEVLENKKDHLGNWWHKDHLLFLGRELGLNTSIVSQNKDLHTAHYRFDVVLEKIK